MFYMRKFFILRFQGREILFFKRLSTFNQYSGNVDVVIVCILGRERFEQWFFQRGFYISSFSWELVRNVCFQVYCRFIELEIQFLFSNTSVRSFFQDGEVLDFRIDWFCSYRASFSFILFFQLVYGVFGGECMGMVAVLRVSFGFVFVSFVICGRFLFFLSFRVLKQGCGSRFFVVEEVLDCIVLFSFQFL